MLDACNRAKIKPAVSFHVLRHPHGSTLAMRGVPTGVIAEQLGHADIRMTEEHYAHLAPSYAPSMTKKPEHGTVEITPTIPDYPKETVRFKCNQHSLSGHLGLEARRGSDEGH
jgi:Phage integrase family